MGHPNERIALRRDSGGEWTGALTWTGKTQAIAFTDTSGKTAITLNGYDFWLVATQDCHIVFGTTRTPTAHATTADLCFYLPANTFIGIYVPQSFRIRSGVVPPDLVESTLYIGIVRNSANGTLYITEALPSPTDLRSEAPTTTSTTTTTTSTTTTTTSTTTTTTSTTTTTTSTTTTTTSTTTTTTSTTSTTT